MTGETPAAGPRVRYQQAAAEHAAGFLQSGMVVGLGSGSTAMFAIRRIGALLQEATITDIVGVPTSAAAEREACRIGIRLLPASDANEVDLTIDGADEVDPGLDLIKGAGGALLREKIVAQASRRVIIVVDERKLSPCLGTRSPLPVECIPFGWRSQARYLEGLGARVTLRADTGGTSFITEQGNLILDCAFGPIGGPAELAALLAGRAGIVEHGLFLGLATDLIAAGEAGITHRTRAGS